MERSSRIVFIGAGNLATNLAKALHREGYHIVQVYSRTFHSAWALSNEVSATCTIHLSEVVTDADLYIVSLTDTAFLELLPQIVAGKRTDALWVHTAGSVPMSVWAGQVERYGVFYPLQTFSKQRQVDFRTIPIFVEGSSEADVRLLKALAETLSDRVYEVTSEQRKSVHLAAVFGCNFANHLYALATEVLEKYGLPFDVLLPLIDETARKVHVLPPKEAQTGPAVRNDEAVMGEHLRLLADEPHLAEIYRLLSESIRKIKS